MWIMNGKVCQSCIEIYLLEYDCSDCGHEFIHKGLAVECPQCHSPKIDHELALICSFVHAKQKKENARKAYELNHAVIPERREAVAPPGKPLLASGGVFNNITGGVMSTKLSLEGFATVLAAKVHFIKASFGGMPGSGKTTSGSDFAAGAYLDMKCTKPLLYIDNEKGSRFLVPFFKSQNIPTYVKETAHLGDILDAMKLLASHEIDMLFIDSLSKVWYQFVRDYKVANRVTFMTLEHWGKILPEWQEKFSDPFAALEGSIVFTGRGGFSYTKEDDQKDEQGNTTKKGAFVQSGVKMKLAGETPFEPDFNVWMDLRQEVKKGKVIQWHEAQILKDRNRDPKTTLDGKTFKNPTYANFKPVISFILGTVLGEVAGPTNTTNLAPSEDYEYQRRKNAREIELEKVKAEFDKQGFGTSKEDKQLKVLIVEKCFGTSSWAEIEKMDPKQLAIQREILQQFFRKFEVLKSAEGGDTTPIQFVQAFVWELDSELPEFLKTVPPAKAQEPPVAVPVQASAVTGEKPVAKPRARKNGVKAETPVA
jgi:hypothetical protein